MRSLYQFFLDLFMNSSMGYFARPLAVIVMLLIIFLIAWLSHFITRKIVVNMVYRVARKTKTLWDDILVRHKVFSGLAHLVPAFILYYASNFSSPVPGTMVGVLPRDVLGAWLLKLAEIYFSGIIVYVVNAVLNAANEIYNTTSIAHHRSIKGYIQLVKILVFFMAGILIVAVLLDKNPTALLAGLGAMAAVLILVFKDTILGFVASIQLSANDMVKIGDWIEMPGRHADGTVTDITLNTVKVQNWDKTIATIPTYALVSETFNNWDGMETSGGRRIKRSILIDMSTIKFCSPELLERFSKFDLIKEYVTGKQKEVEDYNKGKNVGHWDRLSGRNQTNVGIFRKYLEVYLQRHPMINKEMTFLVRQLQPTEKGLPIEIYVFSKDKRWANYETIQADIFDHILAAITEFDLKVFQVPSGEDFKSAFSKIT